MLSLDPARLSQEIERAEQFRLKHTIKNKIIHQRFFGQWFRQDEDGLANPENLIFSYVAFMLPELAFAVPSVRVTARRPLSHQPIAEFMEQGLSAWLSEGEWIEELQDVVRDALMGYGVIKVGLEPRDDIGPGVADVDPLRAFAVRIPPEDLIMDPAIQSPKEARFMGHSYWKDLEDIKADAERWDPEGVDQLSAQAVETERDNQQERALRYPLTGDRQRVNLVDLWIREHGVLLTMARFGGNAVPVILRQQQYWGPPEGPYEVFGFYRVPGDPYPMSAIAAVMDQYEELQAHSAQASDEATTYKRFLLVEATATDVQNAAMTAQSGDVFPVKSLSGTMQQVELGGSPPGRMQHILTLRDRFDRVIGISDAQRGVASGKTATENEIVQSNVDNRTEYLRTRITHSTVRTLRRVGWYMFYDPNVVTEVSRHDPITGQKQEGMFLGGIQPGQEDMRWVQFNLNIEPMSMQRQDDQVLVGRAIGTLNLVEQVLPLMMQFPQVNWRWIVSRYGDGINEKQLADILFSQGFLQQTGQQAGAFGGPPTELPPGANPALAAMGLGVGGGQAFPSGIGGPRPGFTQQPGGTGPLATGMPMGGPGPAGPMPGPRSGGPRQGRGGPGAPPMAFAGSGGPRQGRGHAGGPAAMAGGPMPQGPRQRGRPQRAAPPMGPFPTGPRQKKKQTPGPHGGTFGSSTFS